MPVSYEEWITQTLDADPDAAITTRTAFQAGYAARCAETEELRTALRRLVQVASITPSPIFVTRATRLVAELQRARQALGEDPPNEDPLAPPS